MKRDEIYKNKNNQANMPRLFFVFLLLIVVLCLFVAVKCDNIWQKVNSVEKIKSIVENGGAFSFVMFIILQILQTTVLQIPSILVTLAGTIIFGGWTAFILSFIAVMIGSLIMFWLGRAIGRKFLNWIVGESTAEKWIDKMTHGKYLFVLMMIFPFFPDDILCAVAGVTNMSFSFFFWVNVVARALGIGCTTFFGGGKVIPFSGWGIPVWIFISIFLIAIFYISIRFQDKLDELMKQMFSKSKKQTK